MNQLVKSFKAIRDLGLAKLWYYTRYHAKLRSGYTRLKTPTHRSDFTGPPTLPAYAGFPQVSKTQQNRTLVEADEICQGLVHLFSNDPVLLDLEGGASVDHWTTLERNLPATDIKFIWEPARFGWAITLARAYAFSGDPAYAVDFWKKTLHFLTTHPPNLGRQWQSAQEVAIRLMALVFCDRVFANAPESSLEKRTRLWQAVAEHAQRIPPTLLYARAQNNNHLLSEAAGLYTAGLYLRNHPLAESWRSTGWHWLNWAFQNQIDEFGTYVQHSVNYHRLMLQLGLYCDHLRRISHEPDWPENTKERLRSATRWLWALTDPKTGRTPNLGANDGAYVFPLSAQPFKDHRPVVDAAVKAFLNQAIYNQNNLSEMADWFDVSAREETTQMQPQASDMLRVETKQGRAFLRAAQYTDRPSHADQLHVDLWWRGVNVALDPGTFQYNALPPWDNTLASTQTHNTLTINHQDQMIRAGRFLWLDWAQGEVLAYDTNDKGKLNRVTAEHDGYHKLGVIHQRSLACIEDGWIVADSVIPYGNPNDKNHQVALTWLLQDWDWTIEKQILLHLNGPTFTIRLDIKGVDQFNLFRAGQCLLGEMPAKPTWGWTSPTYGIKKPALMILATYAGKLPIKLQSTWRFEK